MKNWVPNYIHAWITITGPQEKIPDLTLSFLFAQQPTEQDILDAWDRDPRLTRREFARNYRSMLQNALATFGVPRLGQYVLQDGTGPVEVPRVTAVWSINALSNKESKGDMQMGNISLAYMSLNDNTPEPAVPEKSKPLTKVKKTKETK